MTDQYRDDYDEERPRKKQSSLKSLKDVQQLEQSLWLVKLPVFVAEQWATASHNDILGSFRVGIVTEGNEKTPTKQMIVNLTAPANPHTAATTANTGNVQTFVLKEVNSSVSNGEEEMVAFSSNEAAETFSVEGKITKSFVLRPQQSSQYRSLVRERGYQKLAARPETHVAEAKDLQRAQKQTYTIESLTSVQQEMKRKASDKAQGHGGDDSIFDPRLLRSKVIEAFERFQRLPLTQLLAFCMEEVAGGWKEIDVKEILSQYARYHKKGDYKGLWELKEGFASTPNTNEDS
eukprot:gene11793-12866_t